MNTYWWELVTLFRDDPVIVYRTDLHWMAHDVAIADTLIIAPGKDQFGILDIERTNGANWGLKTDDIKDQLRELDAKFGLELIGAGFDIVEFLLRRSPRKNETRKLGEWLYKLCPSLGERPRDFAKKRVALFWD